MTQCTQVLRAEGKAYPRTCQKCGLGPCKEPQPPTPPVEGQGLKPTNPDGTPDVGKATLVVYKNWRGEIGLRVISPVLVWFGATEWHPTPCYLLHCYDWDKADWRDYELENCNFRIAPFFEVLR